MLWKASNSSHFFAFPCQISNLTNPRRVRVRRLFVYSPPFTFGTRHSAKWIIDTSRACTPSLPFFTPLLFLYFLLSTFVRNGHSFARRPIKGDRKKWHIIMYFCFVNGVWCLDAAHEPHPILVKNWDGWSQWTLAAFIIPWHRIRNARTRKKRYKRSKNHNSTNQLEDVRVCVLFGVSLERHWHWLLMREFRKFQGSYYSGIQYSFDWMAQRRSIPQNEIPLLTASTGRALYSDSA